jgi:hypothetical protein
MCAERKSVPKMVDTHISHFSVSTSTTRMQWRPLSRFPKFPCKGILEWDGGLVAAHISIGTLRSQAFLYQYLKRIDNMVILKPYGPHERRTPRNRGSPAEAQPCPSITSPNRKLNVLSSS